MIRKHNMNIWLYIPFLCCVLTLFVMPVSAQQTSMVLIKGAEIVTMELLEQPFEPLAGKLSEEIAHPPAEAATSDIIPEQTAPEDESQIRELTIHSWQPGAPSAIAVHSWQPDVASRITVHTWKADNPSRITVHTWKPGTPSRIVRHGLQAGG